jgi:hypothetical protein
MIVCKNKALFGSKLQMANFTLPNGDSTDVVASGKIRARASFRKEIAGAPGHIGTALFKPRLMVMETIDVVGAALKSEAPSFIALTGNKGQIYWFDAKRSGNAQAPRGMEQGPNVNAIIPVGGIRMRISETVTQAQGVIDAARTEV